MKVTFFSLLIVVSYVVASLADSTAPNLVVYGPVPGLAPSDHYAVRVRAAGVDAPWQNAFVFKTACKDFGRIDLNKTKGKPGIDTEGYAANLSGWSHSYVNFETGGPVEVEISKLDGKPITKATVHPVRYGQDIHVKDGKAFFTLDKPCLVAVDINGDMCDQDTTRTRDGGWYSGPPLHAISIFANPIFTNKPRLDDPAVYAVKPGQKPPADGNWKTLYFLPGVHDIGLAYPLQTNRNYYIPGDAIVYGTFHQEKAGQGHDIRIFGCGTISGDRLPQPEKVLHLPSKKSSPYCPISMSQPYNSLVEGITIVNPAYWSCILYSSSEAVDASRPALVHWVKVLGWRINSDGFGAQANSVVEDCFVRTEDDAIYPCGFGIRRLVIWHDASGSAFLFNKLSFQKGRPLVVEDCDVIFARQSHYNDASAHRTFNMRGGGGGKGGGECGRNVIFRNIRLEDTRPTEQAFLIGMVTHKPYEFTHSSRNPGDLVGVVFQNIKIAAPSIFGVPNILWGGPDCKIRDLTFDNVTIGGKKLTSIADFQTNKYVENIHFR